MENFMDQYSTPEEYIRERVIANNGTDSLVMKDKLIWQLQQVTSQDCDYSKLTKAQLFDQLVYLLGERAYTLFPVGVGSFSFQLKFGIVHKDVLELAKTGLISATGKKRIRMYGKNRYAQTYDPYAYFRLTPDEVHQWLEDHKKK